jgi:hypothetical protein
MVAGLFNGGMTMQTTTVLVLLSLMLQAAPVRPIDPEATKFGRVFRTGVALQSAFASGVNKIRYSVLMEEFTTELKIVAERPLTDGERKILGRYEDARSFYGDVVDCCWSPGEDYTQKATAFRKLLAVADRVMENAHRSLKGEAPLTPEPKSYAEEYVAAMSASTPQVLSDAGPRFIAQGWVGKGRTNTATPLFDVTMTQFHIHWTHKGKGAFVLQLCDQKSVVKEFAHQGNGDAIETVTVTPGKYYLVPMGDDWAVSIAK